MSALDDLYAPDRVRRRLESLNDKPRQRFGRIPGLPRKGLTKAAVLAPLTEIEGQICAVFTKRPDTMAEHSGEVSFPGGRSEESDPDLRATALRETEEEIALSAGDVHLYGALVRMPTVTGYEVTTFVGEFDQPYDLEPNPREIETLFVAPLARLADPSCHRMETRSWAGMDFDLHFYDYDGHVIWGATGFMLHLLLEVAGGESRQTGD